jgi:hypothetical protein
MELAPASNAHGDMPQVGRGRFRRSVIPGVLAALVLFGIVVAGWYYDTLRKKPAEELALPAPDAQQGVAEGEPASVQPPPAEPPRRPPKPRPRPHLPRRTGCCGCPGAPQPDRHRVCAGKSGCSCRRGRA